MSHKAGHIIIQSLRSTGLLTREQQSVLTLIEEEDKYNLTDRLYLARLSFSLAPKQAVEHEP